MKSVVSHVFVVKSFSYKLLLLKLFVFVDGSVLAVALEEGSLMLYSVSGRGYAYRRTRVLRVNYQKKKITIDCYILKMNFDYGRVIFGRDMIR